MTIASRAIAEDWKRALGLSDRSAPEVYSDASTVGDVPHARPIRTALDDLGADSVFCIEGVPTAVFFAAEDADPATIAPLHSDLWNQGLASVLAVVCGDTIRIYSLAAVPQARQDDRLDDDCLIEVLDKVKHEAQVRSLIHGMESGRYWQKHSRRFKPEKRVDGTLLRNLKESDRRLQKLGLVPEAAQALLMQTMFIAYLEDRGIIDSDYIKEAAGDSYSKFEDILRTGKTKPFYDLFDRLKDDFNGDVFIKPCSFGHTGPRLRRNHLPILALFRSAMVEMGEDADQGLLFWAYNFKFIPVELISAVYDQFLSAQDRAPRGQFHTPMHLATSVVSQVWDDPQLLTKRAKERGRFLDPACGSGIFLACLFKRLCEHWRDSKGTERIRWPRLRAFLNQLTGVDIDASAVRVAIFSLYIALLEEVTPPDIRKLMASGKMLPRLWGKRLRRANFFHMDAAPKYDVVIGNPPWRGSDENVAQWCRERGLPVPNKQTAWGFVWKSIRHLKEDGKLALLLPAMPFLHAHSKGAVAARSRLLRDLRVRCIVNYADLRRQLFAKAIQPTALFIGGPNSSEAPYWFHYWAPKAAPSFAATRLLTISDADKNKLDTNQLAKDPLLFNKRLWMTGPEDKLFHFLDRMPALRATVTQFKNKGKDTDLPWTIGQGFQPDKRGDHSDDVADLPQLPARPFRELVPDLRALHPSGDSLVRRGGFEDGFRGPRILVTKGAGSDRLHAAYTETSFTFQHALQAIVVPESDKDRAKVLAAMLNSKLMFWFAFHATASIGSERPEVHQDQLLDLPFPAPVDLPEEQRAQSAAARLVALVDEAVGRLNADILPPDILPELLERVDGLVYDYFGLTEQEIVLVEDTVKYVAPSIQPTSSSSAPIWRHPTKKDRRAYASVLRSSLDEWIEPGNSVNVAVISSNEDLTVVRLRMCTTVERTAYEEQDVALGQALATVAEVMDNPLPGNLHRLGILRVYAGDDLYMVKPNKMRFWTRSAARVDAEQIVVDLWH